MKDIQAFPTHETVGHDKTPGMTLRDYFAAQAMEALIANYEPHKTHGDYINKHQAIAKQAYTFADAMIKERDNG